MSEIRDYVERNDLPALRQLLAIHGLEATDGRKATALTWAAFFGNITILKWLIEAGADVNHQDTVSYTGLHFAAQERRADVLRFLLDHGADPNLKDRHGNGPVWTALMNTREDFVLLRALVTAGAVTHEPNLYGRSPDDMALEMFEQSIPELMASEDDN